MGVLDFLKGRRAEPAATGRRAYLILLWDTKPWSDVEAQEVVSGKQGELGCPVELLDRVQVQGAFPMEPDEYVVSTALLACRNGGIEVDSDRDRISFKGGQFAPGEGAGLITIEIDR
jgi:hypothetical protein